MMTQDEEIPCVTQIPLTYGDTREPIEPERMALIHAAIVRQFHGFTPLGTILGGVWVDEDERREVREDQLRIEIWVARSRIPVLKTLVRRIGYETRQKQMFVIIPEARVDRLDIKESDRGGLDS
jgi:hypothetical protein